MVIPERKPQSRRERERDRRRIEILDAASELFADRGFDAVTMDDVARKAELSKGTLYLYFQSKQGLLLSLATRLLDTVLVEFDRITQASVASGADKFRSLLLAYAEILSANSQKFRVMIGRLASNTPMDVKDPSFLGHRQRIERVLEALVGAVAAGQRDGSVLSSIDPLATALEAWGGMVGIVLVRVNFEELQRRFPRPIAADRLVPEFVETLIRGIRKSEQ